jgi:flagellar biosynthesis protein FliP
VIFITSSLLRGELKKSSPDHFIVLVEQRRKQVRTEIVVRCTFHAFIVAFLLQDFEAGFVLFIGV